MARIKFITGKTNTTRRFGSFLNMIGVTKSDNVHEITGLELLGQYLGQTTPKVNAAFDAAKGGILFIDEAYAIFPSDIYKKEAVDQIVANMTKPEYSEMRENNTPVTVILAGYEEDIDKLLSSNPGLRSRFGNNKMVFKPWGVDESVPFIISQLSLQPKQLENDAKEELNKLVGDIIKGLGDDWGSARDCITIYKKINDNEEIRWQDFQRDRSKRRDDMQRSEKIQYSKEMFEEREAELEKSFYIEAETAPGAPKGSMVRKITKADILEARILIPAGKNESKSRSVSSLIANVSTESMNSSKRDNNSTKKKLKTTDDDELVEEEIEEKEKGNSNNSLISALLAFDSGKDIPDELLERLGVIISERERVRAEFLELKKKYEEEQRRLAEEERLRKEEEARIKKLEEEAVSLVLNANRNFLQL
jgi:hypothetical protein